MEFFNKFKLKFQKMGQSRKAALEQAKLSHDGSVTSVASVAEVTERYVSVRTQNLLTALSSMINEDKAYWSKKNDRSSPLTTEHIALRKYILEQLQNGTFALNKPLLGKPINEVIDYFRVLSKYTLATQKKSESDATVDVPTSNYMGMVGQAVSYTAYAVTNVLKKLTIGTGKSPVSDTSTAVQMTEEQTMEDLVNLFTEVIESIKHDQTEDIQGFLSQWKSRSTQSPQTLPFKYKGSTSADNWIKIQPIAYLLETHYIETSGTYDEDAFAGDGLETFVRTACKYLQEYYFQLLKLNADINSQHPNHWKEKSVKKALDFYFEQREYLYRIVSLVKKEPEAQRNEKITLMRDFKQYIKTRYARDELYKNNYSIPFTHYCLTFGLDKWTKIDSAMEMYRTFCALPGEKVPFPAKDKVRDVRCAGENGELKILKGRGLYFMRNETPPPFVPLNIYGAVKPIRPH